MRARQSTDTCSGVGRIALSTLHRGPTVVLRISRFINLWTIRYRVDISRRSMSTGGKTTAGGPSCATAPRRWRAVARQFEDGCLYSTAMGFLHYVYLYIYIYIYIHTVERSKRCSSCAIMRMIGTRDVRTIRDSTQWENTFELPIRGKLIMAERGAGREWSVAASRWPVFSVS